MNLADYPFYRARLHNHGDPRPWTLEDLEEFAAACGDPFGGRVRSGARVPVALQIEASREPPVWTALEPRDLELWAGGLARLWKRWGLAPGETIAFFDYGSSPLVLLASSSFVAHLKRGAADRLEATAVCNDGVASMAERMVEIVELVHPAALVLRRDVVAPFADALRGSGVELSGQVRWAALSEPEGAPSRGEVERAERRLAVPVRRILRADAAFVIAGDCDHCGELHVDRRLYRLEALPDGEIAVSARFASICPAERYGLGPGEVLAPGCPREPRAERMKLSE